MVALLVLSIWLADLLPCCLFKCLCFCSIVSTVLPCGRTGSLCCTTGILDDDISAAVCSCLGCTSSGPPHHRNTLGEGTNFSFLCMYALSLLWPERSRAKTTWPGLSRRWYASFSCLGFSAVLMIVVFSWLWMMVDGCSSWMLQSCHLCCNRE